MIHVCHIRYRVRANAYQFPTAAELMTSWSTFPIWADHTPSQSAQSSSRYVMGGWWWASDTLISILHFQQPLVGSQWFNIVTSHTDSQRLRCSALFPCNLFLLVISPASSHSHCFPTASDAADFFLKKKKEEKKIIIKTILVGSNADSDDDSFSDRVTPVPSQIENPTPSCITLPNLYSCGL